MKMAEIVYVRDANGNLVKTTIKDLREDRIEQLEEENKKLNIKVASLEGEIRGLNSVIDKLKEENQTLELWLDNKEKVNKKLKEELGEYKKMFEAQLKESYIKNTAEFLDKKFPKVNGFMEEDTLQELKDIGEL